MARRQVGSNQYSTRWGPDIGGVISPRTVGVISSGLMAQASDVHRFSAPPLPGPPGQRLRALTTERSQLKDLMQRWFDELGPWLLAQGPQTTSDGTVLRANQGAQRKRWEYDAIWAQMAHEADEMSAAQALDTVHRLVQSGSWSVIGLREQGLDPEQYAHVEWGDRVARPADGIEDDPDMLAWGQEMQQVWDSTPDNQQRLDMVAAGLHQQRLVRDELHQLATELAQQIPKGDTAVSVDDVALVGHRESSWTQWNHDACWAKLEELATMREMDAQQAVTMARTVLGARKWRARTWCDQFVTTEPGRWSIKEVLDEPDE